MNNSLNNTIQTGVVFSFALTKEGKSVGFIKPDNPDIDKNCYFKPAYFNGDPPLVEGDRVTFTLKLYDIGPQAWTIMRLQQNIDFIPIASPHDQKLQQKKENDNLDKDSNICISLANADKSNNLVTLRDSQSHVLAEIEDAVDYCNHDLLSLKDTAPLFLPGNNACIEAYRNDLLLIEDDLSRNYMLAFTRLIPIVEFTLKYMIDYCCEKGKEYSLVTQDNITVSEYNYKKATGKLTLGALTFIWTKGDGFELWKKVNNNNIDQIFYTLPFIEFNALRNRIMHPSIDEYPNLPQSTVARHYFIFRDLFLIVFSQFIDTLCQNKSYSYNITSNLPRLDHEFIGRDREIERILLSLSKVHRNYLIKITGVGGVGKSALAIEAASRCIEESKKNRPNRNEDLCFDAVVWTSAKKERLNLDKIEGLNHARDTLQHIYADVLRIVDPERYKMTPDKEKLKAETVRCLSSKRVLLVIDNMETIDDVNVYDFLEDLPEPSKAIITDRRITEDNANMHVHLGHLSETETIELIDSHCRSIEVNFTNEEKNDIATQTGGNPLAVIWTIGQVAATGSSVADIISRLTKSDSKHVLEYLFNVSFQHTSPVSRLILEVLSFTNTPLEGKSLARWLILGEDEVRAAINKLYKLGLIYYKLDDITAGKPLHIMEDAVAVLPLTRNYVHRASSIFTAELRKRFREEFHKTIIDESDPPDWPSIESIERIDQYKELIEWVFGNSYDDRDFNFILSLARPVCYALGIRGHNDLRIRYGALACETAEKLGNVVEAAHHRIFNISWVYFIWHKFDQAKNCAEEGIRVAQNHGDKEVMGWGLKVLGQICKERNNLLEADNILEGVRALATSIDAKYLLLATLGSISGIKREMNKLEESEKILNDAIRLSESLKNTEELTSVFIQKLAKIKLYEGFLDEAEALNNKASNYVKRLKRPAGEAYCIHMQALIYEQRDDIQKAYELINKSARLFYTYGLQKEIEMDLSRITMKWVACFEDT